ncbi:hypothetical protein [Nocardia tengchongensis]
MRLSSVAFIHRLIAALATLVGILATLVIPSQVAYADPLDCTAVAAQIEAHNQAAAVHNANPPDSSNQAAVAAYNAEAEQGNAEIPELESLADQCRTPPRPPRIWSGGSGMRANAWRTPTFLPNATTSPQGSH